MSFLKSILRRIKSAFLVFLNPSSGNYAKPAWLDGRETFDLDPNSLSYVFKNLYEFEMTASQREWKQLLFYNEMISNIHDVPGDIAEFGVSGGVSLMAFCRLLWVYDRGLDHKEKRKIYGFDSYEGLPSLHDHDLTDKQSNEHMLKGGFFDPMGYKYLLKFVQSTDNVFLIKGWFNESLPVFINDNPAVNFSMVHIDCDLYESTKDVLEHVWDRVTPGGIVVFDELFHQDFPGETRAFREFFESRKDQFSIKKSTIKPDKKYLIKR